MKRGKLIPQSPVSLSEVFKLSNELQINLSQHWCASTYIVNNLCGWLDGSGSQQHSDCQQFDYWVTPTCQGFCVLACSVSAGHIVLIQSQPRDVTKNCTTSKTAPCDNEWWLLAVIYYHKGFHPRCSRVPGCTEI